MSWFKKKKEIIDLTKLQERGILQRSKEIADRESRVQRHEGEVIDFTSENANQGNATDDSNSGFGFLGSLANAGASNENSNSEDRASVVDNLRAVRRTRFPETGHLSELKNKIEDIEYKLERLIERLERIEGKLGD